MWRRHSIWTLATVGPLSISLALLTACTGGVAQSDFDALKQQASAQEQKASSLQQQLAAREREMAELQQKVTAGAGITTLISAKAVPKPTAAPPPTPLPPGAPTPVPRTAPASYYERVGPFAFYVETLASAGVTGDGFVASPGCVASGVFKRGTRIVWRFEAIDLASGIRVTDRDGATVKVKLPHGEDLTARFSQRGGGRVPDAPWMWSAAWEIPVSYPVGALDYTISIAAKDGRTGTFKVPAVVSPTSDSRLQIVE
ncbi:MAG: hypothetical protein HY690_17815 [Chloroflexi bacterium]|nr:hypothetical protein [Chloroflexota bacterium]